MGINEQLCGYAGLPAQELASPALSRFLTPIAAGVTAKNYISFKDYLSQVTCLGGCSPRSATMIPDNMQESIRTIPRVRVLNKAIGNK